MQQNKTKTKKKTMIWRIVWKSGVNVESNGSVFD